MTTRQVHNAVARMPEIARIRDTHDSMSTDCSYEFAGTTARALFKRATAISASTRAPSSTGCTRPRDAPHLGQRRSPSATMLRIGHTAPEPPYSV